MWTGLLYSWIALSSLTTTGETWYASPPPRWQIHTVDEMEILLGTAERCIATQTGITNYAVPQLVYEYEIRNTNGNMITVTNALTWQLDSGMLVSNDVTLKSVVPYYVRTNTVYDESPDVTMWDFDSLTNSLGIAFDDFGYIIAYTNYEDRYKALQTMSATWRVPTNVYGEVWKGMGVGATWNDAYNAAVSNYALDSSGVITDPIDIHTKGAYWSGFYSNYIPGEYENTSRGSSSVPTTVTLNLTSSDNVINDGTNICLYVDDTAYQTVTNIVVTGNPYPDATGVYYQGLYPYEIGNNYTYHHVDGFILFYDDIDFVWTIDFAWANTNGTLLGKYDPVPGMGGSGILTASVYEVVDLYATNIPSGCYTNDGAGRWWLDDAVLYDDGVVWLVTNSRLGLFSGVSPDESDADWYLYDSQTETYSETMDIFGTSIVDSATSLNPTDPSGTYGPAPYPVPIHYLWEHEEGDWWVTYDSGNYYITQNTNTLTPAWYLESEDAGDESPGLTYTDITGTGIYGTVTAVYTLGGYTYSNTYDTYTQGEAEGGESTNTVFYQCWLTKVGVSNEVYITSDIAHNVADHYVFTDVSSVPADTNFFNDQGFGLTSNVWNLADSNETNYPIFWYGGDMATPPEDLTTPPTENLTTAEGLNVDARIFLVWDFLFATNKYW